MKWKPMRWKPLGWFLGEAAKSVTENLKRGNFNEEKVLATDLGLQLSLLPGAIARQVGLRGLWNLKSLRLPPWELKPSFREYGQTNKNCRTNTQQQKRKKFPVSPTFNVFIISFHYLVFQLSSCGSIVWSVYHISPPCSPEAAHLASPSHIPQLASPYRPSRYPSTPKCTYLRHARDLLHISSGSQQGDGTSRWWPAMILAWQGHAKTPAALSRADLYQRPSRIRVRQQDYSAKVFEQELGEHRQMSYNTGKQCNCSW